MVSSGAEEGTKAVGAKLPWGPAWLLLPLLQLWSALGLTQLCSCSVPHPLQPKVESPDGPFGSNQGFIDLFLPEEAADPASTGPQTLRRIAKP